MAPGPYFTLIDNYAECKSADGCPRRQMQLKIFAEKSLRGYISERFTAVRAARLRLSRMPNRELFVSSFERKKSPRLATAAC